MNPGETEEFAAEIIELLGNPEVLEEYGKQARKRIENLENQFTVDSITRTWQKLFNAVGVVAGN